MEASRTAVATLIARALHQTVDPWCRYADPVAVPLVAGYALARAVEARGEREGTGLLRQHVAARTVFAETALRVAVEARGVAQYVVLGAGYDTFAYRQPAWAAGLRIVEVDRAASQAAKRQALALGGIAIPANVTFAEIDFEHTSLRDGLAASGVDLGLPVFFSWLGVTIYLTRPAVEATLREIAGLAPGSAIAFTYAHRASMNGAWAIAAAAAGEPWLTAYDDDELRDVLEGIGYREIEVGDSCALAVV
jgi:methyltransferase (TIGR00027 family)